jgi:hypothetical protein
MATGLASGKDWMLAHASLIIIEKTVENVKNYFEKMLDNFAFS